MTITDAAGETYTGGSQEWYENRWHRGAGCGPVAASNLIWYMTRPQGGKERYMEIMREMFKYVTPGIRGVNNSAIFTGGIVRYGADKGLQIAAQVLEIPAKTRLRPDSGTACGFIATALQEDAPVAFLNLSNGELDDLEAWHWVTIIAIDTATAQVEVSDHGKTLGLDISLWLKTSALGGALVYLAAQPASL